MTKEKPVCKITAGQMKKTPKNAVEVKNKLWLLQEALILS